MITIKKNSIPVATAILLSCMMGLIPYQQHQQQLHFATAGTEEEENACIDFDRTENTITVMCNASFGDVAGSINDDQSALEELGDGREYLLQANLQVDYGATLSIGPNDIIKWLKIAGA